MPRLPHGMNITSNTVRDTSEAIAEHTAEDPLAFAMVKRVEFERPFDFLFPELQGDANNLLPVNSWTRDELVALGETMTDQGIDDPDGDSDISAAYTYFGMF